MSKLDVNVIDDRRGRARGLGRRLGVREGRAREEPAEPQVDRPLSEPGRARRGRRTPIQAVGAEPRVDLLPMEVADERRARASARRAWLAVVVVGVVVVLATGAATAESLRAGADLTRSQADGAGVLQEQLRFSDVRTVLRETDLIKAAQAVGGAAQIDWSEVLGSVGAALPADTTITGLTVSSMDPLKGFGQSTVPLAQSRVATIDITISSPTVPSIPSLSDSLQQVPGYVGASITAVASADEGAAFTGQVSLELGPAAFDETYEYKAVD